MGMYLIHPIAEIFPRMSGEEFVSLKLDIKERGLLEPIWLYEGRVLDGRHRYYACQEVGVTPEFREYEGDDPVGFVVSLNLKRRHLDTSQRSMISARLANLDRGQKKTDRENSLSQKEAADAMNIDVSSLKFAKKVIEKAEPEIAAAVDAGKLPVSQAAKLADASPEFQKAVVKRIETEGVKVTDAIREEKRAATVSRLESVEAVEAKASEGVYDVIVIDPPWPMQKIERDVRPNQSEFDYPTMDESELTALDIPAADDCHVFVWTTHKFLPMALRLIDRWGMRYVFTMVWHKPGGFQPIGLAQYNCEFVIYARNGTPEFIDTKAFPTCFQAPRGAHSEKPEEFYNIIRRVTAGRKLDMFNRRVIDGFDGWGKEAA